MLSSSAPSAVAMRSIRRLPQSLTQKLPPSGVQAAYDAGTGMLPKGFVLTGGENQKREGATEMPEPAAMYPPSVPNACRKAPVAAWKSLTCCEEGWMSVTRRLLPSGDKARAPGMSTAVAPRVRVTTRGAEAPNPLRWTTPPSVTAQTLSTSLAPAPAATARDRTSLSVAGSNHDRTRMPVSLSKARIAALCPIRECPSPYRRRVSLPCARARR
jgi:hypothetical protein